MSYEEYYGETKFKKGESIADVESRIKLEKIKTKLKEKKLTQIKQKLFAKTSGKILNKLLSGKKSSPPKFNVKQSRFVKPKTETKKYYDGFFK